MTGTSAPCLSVFKPVSAAFDVLANEPVVGASPDGTSLWWQAERLHRLTLEDYARCSAATAPTRAALQREAWAARGPEAMAAAWAAHRAAIPVMWEAARRARRPLPRPFRAYWRRQSRKDGLDVGAGATAEPVLPGP